MNQTLALILIVVLAQACAAQLSGSPEKVKASAVHAGFDQVKLDQLDMFLREKAATTSMVVLHNGQPVFQYGELSEVSYLASCRKSLLAILYGKHVESGAIDLNETLEDLGINDNDPLSKQEKQATVDHIITARSGVFHTPANGGYDEKNVLKRGSVKPGEYFLYNNWDFNVAGHILEMKTGKTVYQEFEEQIAIPLGFEDWDIKKQKKTKNRKKSRYDAYHIYISTRDMAKIGQLMLNNGKWNGKQIVSENWIKKITSTVTPVETVNARERQNETAPIQFSYGYMWWLFEKFKDNTNIKGSYTASGYGGQFITVIPKQSIVIAHKTKLPFLVKVGLRKGGTPSWLYWDIVDQVSKARR